MLKTAFFPFPERISFHCYDMEKPCLTGLKFVENLKSSEKSSNLPLFYGHVEK